MNSIFNTRRRFIRFGTAGLLGLSTAFVLSSCNPKNPTAATSNTATNVSATSGIKTKVLRMGYQQAGDLIRVTKVLEKRLEPLGIKVEWAQFAQGPQLMEAMNVGKIDLGSVGETPPIFAQAAGADIVYVVGSRRTEKSGRGSAIAVPPDSPIKSVKDIKGQKVVFQKASASHYFIIRALEDVGLKPNDIQVLSIPNVEASSAFLEGKIPVWVTGDPHLARAEKLGKVRIIKTAEGLDTPGGYYIGRKQFALDNPELLRIVIEEINKIQLWAEANPKETAKLIMPYQKLDPDVMDLVLSRRAYGLRAISPELIKEQQRVADYFYKNGLLPKPVNIKEAVLTPEQYAAITPTTISQK
ncbi:aliphatic sulfonate ABC transporter substrate-binding protein [Nostoc sp. FACHB-152]|uniref:aliphatic sulfonate ABC transporter substrate-binding protein n=1 Tax=unclassified Nostoc TaxID=2593658 RepID=UPI001687B055|nr:MULTISPECIES: aliphatic sulfonate ABC transporter substrate-binding protein [unclassified Nostoc]MBD2451391.1 aliphatic sulfonate ABC transporter substrate-binding protein [Nostoc sp. FACHB-152]MBD2469403.1 aliphatic sulfonate ABC transporter substrate-binding protein [Nostoc sp. FACHB-145]